MPFNAIQEYDSQNALNNSDIAGNNIAEGCAPGGINNALRELCRQLRRAVANQGTDIAAAASIDIGAASGQYLRVTGTQAISQLGVVNAGTMRFVEFTGAATLNNSASLILPGGASIQIQAGDVAILVSRGAGTWKLLSYSVGNQTPRLSFHAHKNGVNQGGIASAVETKLSFGFEEFDVGGHYDTANSRWVPPVGKYRLSLALQFASGVVDQTSTLAILYKNGAPLKYGGLFASGATFGYAGVSANVDADGGDTFEAYAFAAGAGTKVVTGLSTVTYFCGERIA